MITRSLSKQLTNAIKFNGNHKLTALNLHSQRLYQQSNLMCVVIPPELKNVTQKHDLLKRSEEDFSQPSEPINYQEIYQKPKRLTRKKRKELKYQNYVRENENWMDMELNTLGPVPGSKKKRRRIARGIGGKGGRYGGRGLNGQKSRSHPGIPKLFEGGQNPLYLRVPKYGFSNQKNALKYQPVSLESIQYFIDTGRIENKGLITMKTLMDAGLIKNVKWPGIKITAKGEPVFKSAINIEVPRASKSAVAAIERNGGNIRTVYYGKLYQRYMLGAKKYRNTDRTITNPVPPPKLWKYYMSPEINGYLSGESTVNHDGLYASDDVKDFTIKSGNKARMKKIKEAERIAKRAELKAKALAKAKENEAKKKAKREEKKKAFLKQQAKKAEVKQQAKKKERKDKSTKRGDPSKKFGF